MTQDNELPQVDGRTLVRAKLLTRGFTVAGWFRAREEQLRAAGIEHVEQVAMMLGSRRPYPEIRDLMARDLELTREEFDALIPMPRADSTTADAA